MNRIRDRFTGGPLQQGSPPRLTARTLANRPAASEANRGMLYLVGGDLAADEDIVYISLRNADGTHSWVQIATGTP